MDERKRNDPRNPQHELSDRERKASDRAKLSVVLIGVAFFSSIACMVLAILLFVAF